ncbi:MAG: hypothetical protein FWD23_12185, partial [Oscillospiraceae bacterium]|nr:hypothetical protein [Oscillospiraceae bacterium]
MFNSGIVFIIIFIFPFIILRIIFPKTAAKWIGIIATIFGIFCLIMMCVWKLYDYDHIINEPISLVEAIFLFFIPLMYCITFFGKYRKILT